MAIKRFSVFVTELDLHL